MWNLKGQTAVVTGGSKGIGRATVREFLDLGAKVIFTARDPEHIQKFEEELKAEGFEVTGIEADVSTKSGRDEIVKIVQEKWQALDILVHNAGINIRKKAKEYSEEEYRKVLEINLVAPFELSRMLHPFLKQSERGTVINVASAAAMQDVGTGTPYAMSKAGLLQQTRSLAVEWAGDGIRVNAVSPWFTETPLTEGYLSQEEKMTPILNRTPLNRVAKAEEMSSIIAFLAMEKSSYITGQNIVADGGMSINAI
ncbi:SDR family oxidoreductase [Antarcticibacterium flavum]|uniref:SDR family oxidoreductase n=1 Tax=Antarcticibacterium flavum TaxID=2058175 RepID=A0A5B7X5M5_9FLAO|nr:MULTISPECIES: SDR family oxidoreductase [Antarcticibacterium]MCM4160028.1 tropinone reductase [Antarcticibacterium sp. W02-3]QCY70385.1 SDR family oxidoreductase [Antarcticibacterium flavum]